MKPEFSADQTELEVTTAAEAELCFIKHDADWRRLLRELFAEHLEQYPELREVSQRSERAFVLATARLAIRHGSWGNDFHPYHNEQHIRELLEQRLVLVIQQAGWQSQSADSWLLLLLFIACHDLRQREDPASDGQLIGANEAASIAECWRILDTVGFDRDRDAQYYQTLRLMIAASTFVATGSQAAKVAEFLKADREQTELTLLAVDLDTASVAAPFELLVRAAVRLAKEIEYRADRRDLGRSSAASVFEFLTTREMQFFFEQQRFQSALGRKVFGPRKQRNQRGVESLCEGLRQHYADGLGGVTGGAIIDEFLARASSVHF